MTKLPRPPRPDALVDLDRRAFLHLLGLGAGAAALPRAAVAGMHEREESWVLADGRPSWRPVELPIPAHGDGGDAASDAQRLARYEARDELVLPEGFRYDVVAQWGERFGPAGAQVRFGFNADFTALVPIEGTDNELWLVVNHEYVSARPWLQGYREATGEDVPRLRLVVDPLPPHRTRLELDGELLDLEEVDFEDAAMRARLGDEILGRVRALCRAALDDLGVSVLHARRRPDGGLEVLRDSPHHKRISALHPTTPTLGNCSGGVTPWGTVLTCEENYQDQVRDEVDARGRLSYAEAHPFGTAFPQRGTDEPGEFRALGEGLEPALDGRDFGWTCEVDPRAGTLRKLRRLGRFRHENAAVRCAAGAPLVVYQGDDRRGGHVWKYVSREVVRDPRDPKSSALLDDGTLYVARFEPDGGGRWVALEPDTPLARPEPEQLAGGHLWLPDRRRPAPDARGRVAVGTSKKSELSADAWVASVVAACGRPFDELTLGDLVRPPEATPDLAGAALERHRRDVILLEAFAMANAAGGTPTARPEDVEVHPGDGSLYIAFTDATGSSDGSPDKRVFPDSLGTSSRQYGGILRLEDGGPAATTFTWSRFVSSGELCEAGGAFACADNLCFDPDGNLWMVCDVSTDKQNAEVDREADGSRPGEPGFLGVFGNNALFYVPTRGPDAGKPVCFAIGPMECELTGPTFTPDGRALILSVQHPGEGFGTRGRAGSSLPASLERRMTVADREGRAFVQRRTVPLGSNFPSGRPGAAPRPCVVCITRA